MRRNGINFSNAMSPATTAIQTTLMTPSAKSDAIRAQQQPMHQAPCLVPIWSAPVRPLAPGAEQEAEGLRHLPRQTSFNGVSSYTAAPISVTPATQRPALSHASGSPDDASDSGRDCEGKHSDARPGDEIAGAEEER